MRLKDMLSHRSGLILVTGPTNSGKSTTLAAMVDHLNQTNNSHIITLEDPLEFIHTNKHCLINQRQIGEHARTFADALRSALRADPNVILVGEMRDLETISLALTAAELGLLVLGTLHTKSASQTISRVADAFPSEQQAAVRLTLSEVLIGLCSQQLLRTSRRRGPGRGHGNPDCDPRRQDHDPGPKDPSGQQRDHDREEAGNEAVGPAPEGTHQ